MEPFSYLSDPWKPAQSQEDFRIRLVKLHPTSVSMESSTLDCNIFWVTLKSKPSFKALSYCWGKTLTTRKMLIDGKHAMEVTESLYSALEHLQDRNEPIILWIDQICINQKDGIEKTEQVANMDKIYRAAEEVLVWVGPADQSSDHLFNVWTTVGKEAEDWGMMSYYTKERLPLLMNIWDQVDPTDPKTVEFNQICNRALELFDQAFFDAMISWETRDWFFRVWVVQEFSLARRAIFVCGSKRVDADHVLLARQIFDHSIGRKVAKEAGRFQIKNREAAFDSTIQPFFAARQRRKARDAGSGTGDSLYRLLQTVYVGTKMQATEDCDRVYALLGIANDVKKLQIRADYTIKSRVEFIYTQTARAIIANGNLDMIHLAQGPRNHIKVPSWVPNWSGNLERSFAWEAGTVNTTLFDVSKGSKPELLEVAETYVLGLSGMRVDEIETVDGLWNGNDFETLDQQPDKRHDYTGYWIYLERIRLMCSRAAAKRPHIYSDSKRRDEALWRIPIGDIEETASYDTTRATSSFARGYEGFLFQLNHLALPEEDFKTKMHEIDSVGLGPTHYRSRMREMRNKRPFVSKMGYVGMGPAQMRSGDWIVVFLGAKLPYVIRPYDANNWFLIGECYCDGIMDGEVMANGVKECFYLI